MIEYWTAFAKTGDPNNSSCPQWDTFEPEDPKWLTLDSNKIEMDRVDREEKYQALMARVNRIGRSRL